MLNTFKKYLFIALFSFVTLFSLKCFAISITYGVTVSTEADYLDRLLKQLSQNLDYEDKIIIQIDKKNTNQSVTNIIEKYKSKISERQIKIINFDFNKNFADLKNNLINNADRKGYMFQLDADEYLSYDLMQNLKWFISQNQDADLIMVPRANYYTNDKTGNDEFEKRFIDKLDAYGRFSYPDNQGRIFNIEKSNIKWQGAIHEQITGAKNIVYMPENQKFDLIHLKTFKKQRSSEDILYKIEPNSWHKPFIK